MTIKKSCPYCRRPLRQDPYQVRLPKKRKAIFEAILCAGEAGISEAELDAQLFGGKGKSTVRSAVHYINKVIRPLHIDGRNGYRIVNTDDWR